MICRQRLRKGSGGGAGRAPSGEAVRLYLHLTRVAQNYEGGNVVGEHAYDRAGSAAGDVDMTDQVEELSQHLSTYCECPWRITDRGLSSRSNALVATSRESATPA